jgi:hypothetical protein
MFPAISNLDISWPDPAVAGLDQIQKTIQAQNQYIIQTGSNDAANVGSSFSAGSFNYITSAISKQGIILTAPYFAASGQLYNTVTNSNSTTAALSGRISVVYSAAADAFYIGGESNGVVKILLSATGSAPTSITASGRFDQPAVNGNLIYYGPGSTSGPVKVLNTNNDTWTILSGGNITESFSNAAIAPNNILFFGSGATTHQYYDLNTNTVGTCSGTTDADSANSWILAGDGNLYSVPRFRNTKVYRLNPDTKVITMVLNDANYNSGNAKRGIWIGPDGNIWTYDAVAANRMYSYNWRTNTMSVAPYTYAVGGSDRPYGTCVQSFDAMYMCPWDSGQYRKFYGNVGINNYSNGARVGNQNTHYSG